MEVVVVMCCPLSGNDGDGPEVFDSSVVKAAKQHECSECSEPIAKGATHEFVRGMWDRQWSTYRTCLSCVEIRDHFACDGFIYGELWNDLEENFFPSMTMGGPCMAGLSPAARVVLIERRLAWYLERGEVDDDKWEGDKWKIPAIARITPAFVPPAYASLEYEPCPHWNCRVDLELGYLRRGGLDERGARIYGDLATGEQRIRDAESFCRRANRSLPGYHAESIVPGGDRHG